MKLEKMVGDRFKERPSNCVIDSHALMLRGGYMKGVANGIYSSYMPLKRITRKIEQIIREEMDAIDGQEVSFPVVLPAALWEESGRFESVGSELMRFKDRNGIPMVLGMTHEEAAVQLVREYAQSLSLIHIFRTVLPCVPMTLPAPVRNHCFFWIIWQSVRMNLKRLSLIHISLPGYSRDLCCMDEPYRLYQANAWRF